MIKKRTFDLVASTIGLVVLSPIFLLIVLAIELESGGPAFYRGERMGKGGKTFRIFKFRTMVQDAARRGGGITVRNDPRVTRVGRFLRETKLDELPQLINVIRGEMSLVGPRPEDPRYSGYYSERQSEVLSIVPGITSIASIRYRNEEQLLGPDAWENVYTTTILPTKLDIELNYLTTRSFGQDLLVILATFFAIVKDETRFDAMAERITRFELFAGRYFSWVVIDALIVFAAYGVTFSFRPLSGRIYFPLALLEIVVGITAYVSLNAIFGVYHRFWRYASAQESVALFGSVATATILLAALNYPLQTGKMPIGPLALGGMFTFIFMVAARYRRQIFDGAFGLFGDFMGFASGGGARVLVVGAGEEGQMLTRQLQSPMQRQAYQVVGIVDPDRNKHGLRIHNVPVYGDRKMIPELSAKLHPDLIIIALPPTEINEPQELLALCRATTAQIKMLPTIEDWLGSHVNGSDPGWLDVSESDLLQRQPYQVDEQACRKLIADRVVMVTGASGSIGSELCRQIAAQNPRRLILVDINESGLYDLGVELEAQRPGLNVSLQLCDITQPRRIRHVFDQTRPQLVFHVAAYKHVPILEQYPEEALRVNVSGTQMLHRLAESFSVERFIFISSDKAVNPINTLGLSKWLGEQIVTTMPRNNTAMLSTAVRFGNVLGSRGSVVPIFEKQIELGGPITVTSPQMTRYFLSISEAVSLVIQAAAMTRGGDTYVLDMGKPINILDLANRMIRARGLRPGLDIPIKVVGLRPGEKINEELVAPDEEELPSPHPSIFEIRRVRPIDTGRLQEIVEGLITLADDGAAAEEICSQLQMHVRELRSLPAGQPRARNAIIERPGRKHAPAIYAVQLEVRKGHIPLAPQPVDGVAGGGLGLLFETGEPLDNEESVIVRLSNRRYKLQFEGKVLYCAQIQSERYQIAVKFKRFVGDRARWHENDLDRLLETSHTEAYA